MTLNDYLIGVVDNRGKNPKHYYDNSKYPVLDNYLIKNELYPNMNDCKRYIDQDTFDSFLRGYTYKGMVVMTLVGNGIGNVTTIPSDGIVIIQNTIGFVPDTAKLDNRYLYYFFLSNIDYIKKFDRGSGQPSIKKTDILNIEVDYPQLSVQKQISGVLSSLDEKIAINTAINENLEQQAQALFKAWFVDFEPFGGAMPDDWQNISVYDLADYINGAAFKKAEYGDFGLPIIKIAELKSGITDSTQYCCVSKDDKYYIDDKDILFSWSGNPDTSIDTFLWSRGKAILNQHTFRVVSKYNAPAFTFFLLKYLKPQFAHIASNKQTTGLGHITVADLKRLQFCTNDTAIADFESLTAPIFDTLFSISKENQRLATLRDTLLPKLMNGEIDVSEVNI